MAFTMNSFRLLLLSLFAVLCITGCGGTFEANIGGTVTGLSGGTSVGLLNNGTDALTVTTNGTFKFNGQIAAGGSYNVTITTQPIGETCTVTNGSGSIPEFNAGDVTNISVNCLANVSPNNYVYGNVTGLASGKSVTLLNNGTDTVTSSGGSFIFPTPLSSGSSYNVTVSVQPSGQTCTVSNGVGTIPSNGTNTTVQVTCS
jgi:hypothetical protein